VQTADVSMLDASHNLTFLMRALQG